MKKKNILLFSVKKEQTEKIRKFCLSLGIEIITVPHEHFTEPLGRILGLSLASPSETASPLKSYRTAGFPEPMMVFCGLEQDELDAYISGYAAWGIEKISLKAVLTLHNFAWTPEQLYDELMKEHLNFAQGKK